MNKYDHLSRSELIDSLVQRDAERRFGLVWERERIADDKSVNDDLVLMANVPELSVGQGPFENCIIEGDNFDSLRYLQMTMKGRFKAIYIDPPYNRGLDLIYNDNFVAKDHSYRHSLWLEFMYQRLRIAHGLLRQDGVIFVSIDDKEYAHCKLLLDQVFSERNFMATLIWQTDGNFDNQAKYKISHEYILVYAVDETRVMAPPVVYPYLEDGSKLHNPDIANSVVKNGPKNPPSSLVLPAGFPATFEKGTVNARTDSYPHYDRDVVVENFRLVHPVTATTGWSSKNLLRAFIDGDFADVLDRSEQPTRFELTHTGAIQYVKTRGENHSYVPSVIRNVGSVEKTANYLKRKFGVEFDYPKPIGLVRYLLQMADDPNGLFLDFFAGSGTLGEAIAQLNVADGGQRRFVLASSTEATADNPDKNVCRDVTRRRLAGVADEWAPALNAVYLRTHRISGDAVPMGLPQAEVWLALQQLHGCPVRPATSDEPLYVATAGEVQLVYLPRTDEASVAALRSQLATPHVSTIVYSTRPGIIKERIFDELLEVRPLPASLLKLFPAKA